MTLTFRCPQCAAILTDHVVQAETPPACTACGTPVRYFDPEAAAQNCVGDCWVCRSSRLYVQRDFNRRVGCAFVVVGMLLSVPTKFLSLVAVALIDMVLYLIAQDVTVCYKCDAQYREVAPNPTHGPFDLVTYDSFRSEKYTHERRE